jgi:hypothetical protein
MQKSYNSRNCRLYYFLSMSVYFTKSLPSILYSYKHVPLYSISLNCFKSGGVQSIQSSKEIGDTKLTVGQFEVLVPRSVNCSYIIYN